MERIIKIKSWVLVLYYLALYLPIYKASIFGATFSANIAKLNARVFYVILFTVLIIGVLFIINYRKKFSNYANYAFLGISIIFILIVIFSKASTDQFGLSVLLQLVFIVLYAVFSYLPNTGLKLLDGLNQFRSNISDRLKEEEVE